MKPPPLMSDVLFQIAFPHTAVLGQLPGASTVYRNVKQYPDAQLCPGILAFRIGKMAALLGMVFARTFMGLLLLRDCCLSGMAVKKCFLDVTSKGQKGMSGIFFYAQMPRFAMATSKA